ncbi:probable WRKY transcription factor 14 isoform X2 [Andrographis paniculata]|uniref:probable WRKY transcription factor 14 isoform X2 n=1 Tax=Andrographis paniculata TaxID=175694 RepID=UPI0021E6ECE3|nr:probable WRKY transcription factor 14 isoform X2 [Andrographis paniculata]
MCSYFPMKRMENYQGDLNDVIRGSTVGGDVAPAAASQFEWQFPINQITYCTEEFGDPFVQLRDPLLHDIDTTPLPAGFFHSNSNIIGERGSFGDFAASNSNVDGGMNTLDDDAMKRPSNNIFSRVLQISPTSKAPASESPAAVASSTRAMKSAAAAPVLLSAAGDQSLTNTSKGCLMESPAGLQISSPRNTGIKKRKGQAKKVVCIPAPAPANSRPSGEVVPSDLWAWRKYGQKPIKGSPYPRGYYRCSSSKGCSARKQVERSRTDPNMLVITYTSEHNHPWPTQRNALAGSTRSQPFKPTKKASNPRDEDQKETAADQNGAAASAIAVKEETELDNQLEMEDAADHFDEGFPSTYMAMESNLSEDSFFADLGEIEGDHHSLEMLFANGEDKCLDSFGFYEWAVGNSSVKYSAAGTATSPAAGATASAYTEAKTRDS